MSNIVIGTRGLFEQPINFHWSPSRGWTTQRTFRGERSEIRAAMFTFRTGGWDVHVTEGPTTNSTMVCTIGADIDGNITEPMDTWEIQPNSSTRDLLESDNAAVAGISKTDKEILRAAENSPTVGGSVGPTGAAAIEVYLLMLTGVKSVMVFQPVLRHTFTVARTWQVVRANENLRKIITTGRVAADESIPAWIVASMPNETPASSPNGLAYAWFKFPPSITVVSYNKTQIVQEWQYGLWSTLLYGNPLV